MPIQTLFANRFIRGTGRLSRVEFQRYFDLIDYVISSLTAVHSKSQLTLDNIESVFATIEMCVLINKLPGISNDSIEPLISSLKKLILRTLEDTIAYPIKERSIVPTPAYRKFADLISDLNQGEHTCSIMTFNYDYALDYALRQSLVPIDYGLSESSGRQDIPLIKLHGSLNWAQCSKCKELISLDIGDYLAKSNTSLITHARIGHIHIHLATNYIMKGVQCEVQ